MTSRSPGMRALMVCSILALQLGTQSASAQHDDLAGSAPPPPPGPGRVTVSVTHPDDPAEAAGVPLALYALAPDGTPGLAGGETGADGRFTFEDLSTDPGIVYLVGARYREIPFAERFTFSPDATSASVEIEIVPPTERTEGVRVEELRARVDWMGDRVVVQELVRLVNPGSRVILLPRQEGGKSIFERPLPAEATDFSAGATSLGEAIVVEDGSMRFRGPLYPGDQRIEYAYSLPLAPEAVQRTLPIQLDRATERVVVVAGTDGIRAEAPGLVESSAVESDAGRSLASWARGALRPGRPLEVRLQLPESRRDPTLVRMPRGDVWLELDDARLTATLDLTLEVPSGTPIAGSPAEPLLRIELPPGARLGGVAPEAERLGLVPNEAGGFDVIGPIPPGTTHLGYSYELAAKPDGIDLAMRFPREVETLNVLIADTGLAVSSDRLHRRRPFRSGTRNYLHHEAFNVAGQSPVHVSLEPLRNRTWPRSFSIAAALAAAAVAAIYLSAPLRAGRRERAEPESGSAANLLQAEREAVYSDIADLDHDFETGKLEADDYHAMRDALRSRAIEILRVEQDRSGSARVEPEPASSPAAAAPAAIPRSDAPASTGTYCPQCGEVVRRQWRFCSHCGQALEPPADGTLG